VWLNIEYTIKKWNVLEKRWHSHLLHNWPRLKL
jgi:hypothetical protein